MELKRVTPRVITYAIRMDKNDEEYASCMWAKFIFDCDSGQLNINSDAGDFSYRWGFNENEDFMHLMTRINRDYLLDKISSKCVFDLEESKKETIHTLQFWGTDIAGVKNGQHVLELIEQINNIEDNCSEEYFIRAISEDILPTLSYEDMDIVKNYPRGAETVVSLFTKYIQPQIKEDIYEKQEEVDIELD